MIVKDALIIIGMGLVTAISGAALHNNAVIAVGSSISGFSVLILFVSA